MLQTGMSVKNQNRMANSVDPAETAHFELFHQDLHCLHRYLVWSIEQKGKIALKGENFNGEKGINIIKATFLEHSS